ncbi:hypothetical protein ESZ50_10080 [Weissella muntiaci]|uniref:Transporter n=1 Tax=Weissella muntiaci TaxID=2508881 RepID=A0A6C2C280_9LACO|nr:hypothetical protein [Weissella muntiaci]TYC48111.1 hypothetical protein ESZ50_10080 [Weissella muntiaci]
MKKEKLALNRAAGIFDIINAVVFTISFFVIVLTAVSDAISHGNNTGTATLFFYGMALLGLLLHILGLLKSRKAGFKITGHILGIIGNGIFFLSAIMAIPATILLIVASVFTLQQRQVNK